GTRVNGVQVGRPRNRHLPAAVPEAAAREIELHDGDVFQVGDTSFGVTIAGPAEDGSPWEVDTPLGEELAGGCAGCAHGLAVQRSASGAPRGRRGRARALEVPPRSRPARGWVTGSGGCAPRGAPRLGSSFLGWAATALFRHLYHLPPPHPQTPYQASQLLASI